MSRSINRALPPQRTAHLATSRLVLLGAARPGRELFAANLASLKSKAEVKINQAALEKDSRSGDAPAPIAPPSPSPTRQR